MMPQFHRSASATTFIDSFQSSLAVRLRFYSSSQRFYSSINSRHSRAKSGFISTSDPNSELSSNWIGKWDEANRYYRPKQPLKVLNYRAAGNVLCSAGSGGGRSTMDRIVEKLKKFGYMDGGGGDAGKETMAMQRVIEKGLVEDIFYVEDGMLPNTRGGFSQNKKADLGVENVLRSDGDISFPWEKKTSEQQQEVDVERSKNRTSSLQPAAPVSQAPKNSVEYRRELCEKYGFMKIAEPLPGNVTLKDIIDTLPKEVFEIDEVKSWKSVLVSATSYALGLFIITKSPRLRSCLSSLSRVRAKPL